MSKRRLQFHSATVTYFDAVRRYGSIREAARRLNVASSAVNRQILKLEDELGEKLFNRIPSGLQLTPAGEVFSRHINLVIQDTKRLSNELDALQGLYRGNVNIVSVESLATELLPNVIEIFQEKYPKVSIGVKILGSQDIPQEIISGKADLGLAFALPKHNELYQIKVAHMKLGAIVSPNHPLASLEQLSFAQCLDYDLIWPKSNLSIYQQLAPLFMDLKTSSFHFKIETSSLELAKQLVIKNKGISFQTIWGLENEILSQKLKYFPLTDNGGVYCDLGLYMSRNNTMTSAIDALSQIISEQMISKEN